MLVIFDLDQTLVDSSSCRVHRDCRNWRAVYECIPDFLVYDGIYRILEDLQHLNIKTAIVTNSPRPYCCRVTEYFGIDIACTICFHDTKYHKPYPDPIIAAMKAVRVQPGETVLSLGDDASDMLASNSAGIISVACTWGTLDRHALLNSGPKFVCGNVESAHNLIRAHS